jgi:hypothetical protein
LAPEETQRCEFVSCLTHASYGQSLESFYNALPRMTPLGG